VKKLNNKKGLRDVRGVPRSDSIGKLPDPVAKHPFHHGGGRKGSEGSPHQKSSNVPSSGEREGEKSRTA